MSETKDGSTRREFLKIAGGFAAGAVVGGAVVAATQSFAGPAVTQTVTESTTETMPPSVGDVDAFRSALEKDGFIVGQGAAAVFPLIEAYEAGLIKACWGNDRGGTDETSTTEHELTVLARWLLNNPEIRSSGMLGCLRI